MKNILNRIMAYKREEIAAQKRKVSLADIKSQARDTEAARPFRSQFLANAPRVKIIAEIKRASPSLGPIVAEFDPVRIAAEYEDGGAVALSILTDEKFFSGHLDFIKQIKNAVTLPCLRKDFLYDPYQIYQAKAAEADAVLLIAAVLAPSQLRDLADLAAELGMAALVEIHDEKEWQALGAPGSLWLVGVNHRDLKTFQVDLSLSERLRPLISADAVMIAESGIGEARDVERLLTAGVQGFLIGESLMKAKDRRKKLAEFMGG